MAISEVKEIRNITLWGMLANFFLAAIKFVLGIVGSSQSVIADAVHSISDMATDIAVIFGVYFWSAPPDHNHPYGHRKYETFVTLFIGLSLASVAIGLAYNAFGALRQPEETKIGLIAILGPIFSVFTKELLYRWTVGVGKKLKSSAVIANAWHHRSDALSSIPAVIAVFIASIYPHLAFFDQIGAIIIAVFILKISWDIILPSLKDLTDFGLALEKTKKIKRSVLNIKGVEDTHAIRARKSGSSVFVDLHVLVNPEMTVRDGHEISSVVKHTLINEFEEIVDVVVHLEPNDNHKIKYEGEL